MYYNVSFMGQDPMNFYVSPTETDETVSYETYQLYMSGDYIKGNDGQPQRKEQTTIQATPPDMSAIVNNTPTVSNDDFYGYLTDKIKALQKQMENASSTDNIYRVAHGDFIPVPTGKNPSDFMYEILSVQVAGDNFNSPNIGMLLKPPQFPFYQDANITIGLVNINQAYVSNNETDPMKHITGWLTIKVNEKPSGKQNTNGQPVVTQPST